MEENQLTDNCKIIKSFPHVWAIREKTTHVGAFSDDKAKVTTWSSRSIGTEMKEFNIIKDWHALCAFFDGWGAADFNMANKLRENIFKQYNYDSVQLIV